MRDDRMIKDAEAHAEEDRKAHELVDARNRGDGLMHSVRKSMKEAGDKVDAADKEKIELALSELDAALKSDDKAGIESKTQALTEASHKLAEHMYAQASAGGQAEATAESNSEARPESNDNVVDAEFEEVKDKKSGK